jgi:hypothetical protein
MLCALAQGRARACEILYGVHGQRLSNPEPVSIDRHQSDGRLRKMLAEFGMTPASRSRINVSPPAPDKGATNDPYAFLA